REFNGTHQFIYAVSFIAPVLYLFYEEREALWHHINSNKRTTRNLKVLPPGFGWVLTWSFFVFLFTAFAFAISTRTNPSSNISFIEQLSSRSALLVYIFALSCWYL